FRVLEEISKVVNTKISKDFKKLRFRLYELEKKSIPKIKHLCNS
ncbi:MAG: thiamine-phosphate pyrophosphorylase, partial [Candidatus Omnitrophica bacterium]|nr:thiamine-phosphate pyrophosphorylase [Candidatus Omnitrophota bacterium]